MLKPLGKLRGAGLVWFFGAAVFAQDYSISTVAGGAPPTTPAAAASTAIGTVKRVTTDASGNVYFSSGNAVFKISSSGTLTLVAGNSRPGFSGDGGPAAAAQLNTPQGLAVDSQGNLYIADQVNNRVRVVTPQGVINTFAGNGQVGKPRFLGDAGLATAANLNLPGGVAVDHSGNVYIADTGDNSIRKVGTNGIINTIAGNGFGGLGGDTLPATGSVLLQPEDVFVDSSNNVYIADTGNAAIREITASTGIINFIAGVCNITSTSTDTNTGETCAIGYAGDGGLANAGGLVEPFAVAVDSSGNVYIAEPTDGRVREISTIKANIDINTIVGNGTLVGEPVHGADADAIGGSPGDRPGPRGHPPRGAKNAPWDTQVSPRRAEIFDIDAGGDFGDAGDVKEAAHFIGVGSGNGDDVAGGLADAALVVIHAVGLEFEVRAVEGVGGVLDVAAPDHGFDVVLEKDGMGQVGEVTGGSEVIDDGAIEAFLADEVFEEGAHAGRMEAFDGNGNGREETADQFGIERGAGFGRHAVGEGVGLVGVFVGAGGALGLGGVGDGDVVDFMPAMQMAEHLQSADLSALGGGVHEIGIDPEGLHTMGWLADMTPSQRSSRLPVRNMSPHNWRVSRRQTRSVASSRPETWRWRSLSRAAGSM